jgi:hypothetical protein
VVIPCDAVNADFASCIKQERSVLFSLKPDRCVFQYKDNYKAILYMTHVLHYSLSCWAGNMKYYDYFKYSFDAIIVTKQLM